MPPLSRPVPGRRNLQAKSGCRYAVGFIPALLLALWYGCTPLDPPPTSRIASDRYAATIAIAQDTLQAWTAQQHIPGISVAVGVEGQLVWSQGFGFADVEQHMPVTPQTVMRIASLSKPLTSAGMALLIDAGRLDLDAPIQTYVPAFPAKRYPITTRQLAGHLAGIRHHAGPAEFYNTTAYPSVTAALGIFDQDSLLFQPGTQFLYSTYGWTLISAAIENVAGQNFLDFMQTRVFDPMGMPDTQPDRADASIPHRARFYRLEASGHLSPAPAVDYSSRWAGGGFLSTANDLVRFGHAMLDTTFLRQDTRSLLFTSLHTANGQATRYGLGWASETRPNGTTYVGHTGGGVGASSVLVLAPRQDRVVVLLCNLEGVTMHEMGMHLLDLFMPPNVEGETVTSN